MNDFIQVGDENNETGMFFINVQSVEIKSDESGGGTPYTLVINKGLPSEYKCPAQDEDGGKIIKWVKSRSYSIKDHVLTKESE